MNVNRTYIEADAEQDRIIRGSARRQADLVLAQGPLAHVPSALLWGAGIGAAIGAMVGPVDGKSRVLKYAAWGAAINVGTNLLGYETVKAMRPGLSEPSHPAIHTHMTPTAHTAPTAHAAPIAHAAPLTYATPPPRVGAGQECFTCPPWQRVQASCVPVPGGGVTTLPPPGPFGPGF